MKKIIFTAAIVSTVFLLLSFKKPVAGNEIYLISSNDLTEFTSQISAYNQKGYQFYGAPIWDGKQYIQFYYVLQ